MDSHIVNVNVGDDVTDIWGIVTRCTMFGLRDISIYFHLIPETILRRFIKYDAVEDINS